MTSILTPFERAVRALTARLLEEHRSQIRALELSTDQPEIRVLTAELNGRCSELEVVFRRGREIADVFEFFVEKDGVRNMSLAELEQWLRTELADLPRRHA